MEKFIPCRNCAGKGVRGQSTGYIYNAKLNAVKECECHIRYRINNGILSRLEKIGVGRDNFILHYDPDKDYVGTKSADSVAKIKKFIAQFKDYNADYHHVLLYLYGTNGTQKSTLGKYICKEVVSTAKDDEYKSSLYPNYYKAMFITMNDLIKQLTIIDVDKQEAAMKKVNEADVLVIDESFDKEKVTIYKSGYQIPFLDSFLRKFMNDPTKSIIFISNVSPQDIEANGYSHSLQDFVERFTKIQNSAIEFKDNYIQSVDRFSHLF